MTTTSEPTIQAGEELIEELRAWLETAESRKVGMIRKGETESVGHQSARRILEFAIGRSKT